MKNFYIKDETGRSMIEMLGVLAIIGVLSVGGIAGYSKAMTKYRINKTIEQITLIAGNVRAFFGPQKSYEGLNTTVIKKAKLVPDDMWDGDKIKNVFGWSVSLFEIAKSTSTDKQAFYINYAIGDNVEACIELLSQDWTTADVKAIYLNNAGYFKIPVEMDKAVEKCSTAIASIDSHWASYGLPYMYFYFDIDLNSSYWSGKTWEN